MAPTHRLRPAWYYALVFAAIVVGALAQGWFTWWADPFGVRGSSRPKVTALLGEQRRLFKAHDVLRQPPELVLCGTSRTEQALEPGHPAIAALGFTAYNLAMPGSSIYEQHRMIQHAHARHPLQAVWLELAFLVTAADQPRTNPGFSEERLLVDAAGRPQPLHDLADLPLLLSLDGQGAAWRTIRSGSSPRRTLAETFDRGHFLPKNLDFAGNSRTSFVLGARKLHAEHYRRFVASDAGGGNRHLDDLAALLAFCRANRIAVTLFYSPEHAYYGWLLTRSGLWPAAAAFKQRVLELAGDDVPVWDFSAVGAVTAEPIPPADRPGRTMVNYNDAGHFTTAVGRRMIATLAAGAAEDGFGVRLRAATLAAELERQAALLRAWAADHPADAAEVEALAH